MAENNSNGVTQELRGRVLWLTLDRPRAANAVDPDLGAALVAALNAAQREHDVAAVVLTGAGPKIFSAGIDVKNPDGLPHVALARRRRETVAACMSAILDFDKPLVAAVNGLAIGLGAMLALLCDRVVATDTSAMSLPEIDINIPTFLGISILNRIAGTMIARELVLTGRRMPAAEALQKGLIGEVVTAGELREAAQRAAEELAGKPAAAYALNKRWLTRGLREEFDAANSHSASVQTLLHPDAH